MLVGGEGRPIFFLFLTNALAEKPGFTVDMVAGVESRKLIPQRRSAKYVRYSGLMGRCSGSLVAALLRNFFTCPIYCLLSKIGGFYVRNL